MVIVIVGGMSLRLLVLTSDSDLCCVPFSAFHVRIGGQSKGYVYG